MALLQQGHLFDHIAVATAMSGAGWADRCNAKDLEIRL
jgi:hypothetical protein